MAEAQSFFNSRAHKFVDVPCTESTDTAVGGAGSGQLAIKRCAQCSCVVGTAAQRPEAWPFAREGAAGWSALVNDSICGGCRFLPVPLPPPPPTHPPHAYAQKFIACVSDVNELFGA